jgi:hypothetical protein
MSETGEAKAEMDTLASGAKPRPEGRVCERGWRPTRKGYGIAEPCTEAARRFAIARARRSTAQAIDRFTEDA